MFGDNLFLSDSLRKVLYKSTLVVLLLCSSSCGLFESNSHYPDCNLSFYEMHDHLPNFGFEDGYFYWFEEGKIPLKRNRNHLSIRFYEEYGEAFHDSVLEAYNIEPVWSQTFGKEVPMPGYYRVREKSANEYYTTYGETTLDRLGNLPEVEYVLPTYYVDERFCDLYLTPKINFTFHDHYSEEQQKQILDSLQTADNIKLSYLFEYEWSKPGIYVTKSSPTDPYSLYHHYYEHLPYFRSISLNFAQTARR